MHNNCNLTSVVDKPCPHSTLLPRQQPSLLLFFLWAYYASSGLTSDNSYNIPSNQRPMVTVHWKQPIAYLTANAPSLMTDFFFFMHTHTHTQTYAHTPTYTHTSFGKVSEKMFVGHNFFLLRPLWNREESLLLELKRLKRVSYLVWGILIDQKKAQNERK